MNSLITQKIELPAIYSVSVEATKARGEMIRKAQAVIAPITSPEQNDAVAAIGCELQKHKRDVQEMRKSLTRPFDEATAKLIKLERDYLAPIEALIGQASRETTAYRQAEDERVRLEEAARQAELQRLEDERIAAEKRSERARTVNGQLKAELQAHNATQAQEELLRSSLPTVTKARGAAIRKKLCYRVTDIKALYAARPELCTVEVKPSAIQAVCSPTDKIPGLDLWEESATSFRP